MLDYQNIASQNYEKPRDTNPFCYSMATTHTVCDSMAATFSTETQSPYQFGQMLLGLR